MLSGLIVCEINQRRIANRECHMWGVGLLFLYYVAYNYLSCTYRSGGQVRSDHTTSTSVLFVPRSRELYAHSGGGGKGCRGVLRISDTPDGLLYTF